MTSPGRDETGQQNAGPDRLRLRAILRTNFAKYGLDADHHCGLGRPMPSHARFARTNYKKRSQVSSDPCEWAHIGAWLGQRAAICSRYSRLPTWPSKLRGLRISSVREQHECFCATFEQVLRLMMHHRAKDYDSQWQHVRLTTSQPQALPAPVRLQTIPVRQSIYPDSKASIPIVQRGC